MDKKRAYTLYSLVRLLFDEAILAAIVLWLLPAFGIRIPVWLLIVLMVVWVLYSYLTSGLVGKVIGRAAAVGPEALIGVKGTTTTPLAANGYVRVGTELWQARSIAGDIESGVKVVIVGIDRLTLLVKPSFASILDKSQHFRLKSEVVACKMKTTVVKSCNQEGTKTILTCVLDSTKFLSRWKDIPSLGMFDVTPLIAMLILYFIPSLFNRLASFLA